MEKLFADYLIRWRWIAVVLIVIFVGFAVSGARFLSFSSDYRIFFSEDNPELLAYEELQNTYTKSDSVMFVLTPSDRNLFTPRTLEAIEWLTEESWQIPYSIRVDSLANFQHTYAVGDDLIVEDLVRGAQTLDASELEEIERIALSEPQLENWLVSPQGDTAGVNVVIQLPEIDVTKEIPEVVQASRKLANELTARFPDMEVHLTGIVMLNNAFTEVSLRDATTIVPAMFVVITLVIAILLRSLAATLVTLLIIFLSIVSAIGIAGWLGIQITPPSASSPTMIMTLAVANCIHILTTFLQKLRSGKSRIDAMHEGLRINLQPVVITTLTTAIGFMSMNFSDAPPFRDLGNIVAVGVVLSMVYCLFLIPAIMLLVPEKPVPAGKTASNAHMDGLASFVIAQRKPVLWGMLALIIVLVAFIPQNELNDEFVDYFDERVTFRVDADYASDNLTGLNSVSYSLGAGASGAISEPAFLRTLDEFVQWFRAQPEVYHVSNLSDTMKRLNKNLHGDEPEWYRIPDSRELAAQYLLLYEMSLPYGLDLNNQINVDKSATKLTVVLRDVTSNEILDITDRAAAWLKNNAPESMQVNGASTSVMFAHIGYRNIRSMLVGTTLALMLISFILIFALRSLRIGLISVIPNLVPAAMAFGLWGILVGQVGLALSIVTGMTLGIVVDDTVHFLSKYLRARREEGLNSQQAVRYAFNTVGTALWTTSVVLVAGFLVLTNSPFELNSGMGLLTAITIALALFADFLLLPALLMATDKRETQ